LGRCVPSSSRWHAGWRVIGTHHLRLARGALPAPGLQLVHRLPINTTYGEDKGSPQARASMTSSGGRCRRRGEENPSFRMRVSESGE
jgi:hypothetical protein